MHRVGLTDSDADIVVWSVRAFYIFAAYAIIIVRFIPDLRDRFLEYGARSDANDSNKKSKDSVLPHWVNVQFGPVLDWLAELTVPHSWFAHFYICSTICSAVWIYLHKQDFEYVLANISLSVVADWHARSLLGMLLMQIQGLRRLYECLIVAKSSHSRMWVGHYVIGIAFYLATNLAIWFEPAFDSREELPLSDKQPGLVLFNGARITLCLVMFYVNSYRQFQVHQYLAGLTSYQVPSHPIFEQSNLICPHYAFEFNIYVALAILTARNQRVLNSTLICAVFFVVVNLGVTADGTKKWLMNKFPKQRFEIAQRKRMFASVW